PDATVYGEEEQRDGRPVVEIVLVSLLAEDERAEAERIDGADAEGAVREVEADPLLVGVAHELRDDLPEAERHDGEVVAAEPERGQADEDADHRREDAGDGEDEPHRDVEAGLVIGDGRTGGKRELFELQRRKPAAG